MNERERNDIIVSWLTISLAFAFLLSNISIFSFGLERVGGFPAAFVISLFAVGGGFVLHELAHKYVAIRYGCHAEFRAWQTGLIIAILAPLLFGFIFAAPGAVYIYGKYVSPRQNGIISLAGPGTNIVLGLFAFLTLAVFTPIDFIANILIYTFFINFFLAMFNLIPFFILDGAKVFAWSPLIWAMVFFPTLIIAMVPGLLLQFV